MKLIQARSVSYGGTRSLSSVKYIVIHYTGNKGDTATGNVNYFAHTNTRPAGAHIFIDRSGLALQSIPLNRIAWSVGGRFASQPGGGTYYGKCTNSNSVSIELCDIATQYPSDKQIAATRDAIKWIRSQCPNAKTIIRHWDVNNKSCPARMAGKDNAEWKKFKAALAGSSTKPASSTTSKKKTTYTGKFPTLPKRGYFQNGDSGTQVQYLQKFLNWYGNYKLTLDGSYGPKTVVAVKKFQKSTGLKVDGCFGSASLKKAKSVKK